MKICLVHSHRPTREILTRALARELGAEVVGFSSIENVLDSSLDYAVFVLYSSVGKNLDRNEGAPLIRARKPESLVISVTHNHFFARKSAPGGDLRVFVAGRDVRPLAQFIRENAPPSPQLEPPPAP